MEANSNTSWPETAAGQQLQKRLNEDRTVRALDRILDRIETLEQAVTKLGTVMDQAPGMISMLTDTLDEQVQKAKNKGLRLEDRLTGVLQLVEKVTAPETIAKLDNLDRMMEFWEQAPGHMAMMVDVMDEEMGKALESGVDLKEIGDSARKMGLALSKANQMDTPTPKSIWGLLKALKDPDRQAALGFLLKFTKALGQELK